MNHRYTLSLFALAGTLLGAGVAAEAQTTQPQPPPNAPAGAPRHHHGMMGRAMAGLNLSDAQKGQIRAAREKFKASQSTNTPETHQQLMSDVEGAMSPTQRTQFEGNLKTMRAQMRAERRDQGAPAPVSSPSN